jgi:hypothetical protein
MIRFALALGAGYTAFKLAYHSEDGRYYADEGEQGLRAGLGIFFGALAGGVTYAALLLR